MKKNKYSYLAKNTFLFMVSSFGSKLLTFFLVPLYTSVLSTSDYGTADLLTTTTYLLLFIVTLNIADAVLRFVIERKDDGVDIFGYGIRVILKGNFWFLILLIIFALINPFHWTYYIYMFLFSNVFLSSLQNLFSYYLRALDKVKDVAIGGILSTAATIICNIFTLLILKIGIIGYLFSLIAGPLIATLFYFAKYKVIYYAFIHASKDEAVKREMVKYCVPLILNGIAWWISASLDKYFIAVLLDTSANGIYSVAQKIPSILTTFTTIFMQAWNLSAIKEFDKEDQDGFFTNTYKIANSALVIGCSMLVLINIPLAKILYINDFFVAWQCSSWLLLSVVFSSMSSFEGSIFSAVKKTKIASASTIISALINTTLNYVLIPIWGVQGAAIATVVSFLCVWLIRYVLVLKYIRLRNNIFIELLLYLLLVCQVILERFDNHCYWGQILIFAMVLICNKNNLNFVFVILKNKIKAFPK